MMRSLSARRRAFVAGGVLLGLTACQPTVKLEAPDKPIEINQNIKIEQEVRVKVERDLEEVFTRDPALFGLPGGSGQR
jgi:site-specific recombinase XerC